MHTSSITAKTIFCVQFLSRAFSYEATFESTIPVTGLSLLQDSTAVTIARLAYCQPAVTAGER